ncbi:hypothetical protein MAPG_00937 [Magnaporthiopsis poae ATCC 64411]|uniref:Uncharacterized protein n=1 Tax=Magnaporthiopsis poae (strain ATCC 64411 / 73-15) TaxID=644358 RepID=A0A0C4DMD2_MAGP6|nr:hypothetical protein MAPG_00937 [Magnaporthiopsis poae ATCC 64411]
MQWSGNLTGVKATSDHVARASEGGIARLLQWAGFDLIAFFLPFFSGFSPICTAQPKNPVLPRPIHVPLHKVLSPGPHSPENKITKKRRERCVGACLPQDPSLGGLRKISRRHKSKDIAE